MGQDGKVYDNDAGYLNYGGSMYDLMKKMQCFCEEKPVRDTKMVKTVGWVGKQKIDEI